MMADILSPQLVRATVSAPTKVGLHWLFRADKDAVKDPGVDYFSIRFPWSWLHFHIRSQMAKHVSGVEF